MIVDKPDSGPPCRLKYALSDTEQPRGTYSGFLFHRIQEVERLVLPVVADDLTRTGVPVKITLRQREGNSAQSEIAPESRARRLHTSPNSSCILSTRLL